LWAFFIDKELKVKIRKAFVSNSSSSSFLIEKKYLSEEQLEKIRNHDEFGMEMGILHSDTWKWDIHETRELISGDTWMDNFDMEEFLEKIGVPKDRIEWSEFPYILREQQENNFLKKLTEEAKAYTNIMDGDAVRRFVRWIYEKRGKKAPTEW
jgi:hypothetical protein